MRSHREARRLLAGLAPFLLLGVALALASCAKPQRAAESLLDTPDHHTLRGNDFLDQDQWDQAEQEFNQALSLDRNYGPALSGKAIVMAHNATLPGLTKDQRGDKIDQAQDLAKKGLGNAKGDDQKRAAYVARVRVYTLTKDPDSWLKKARSDFEDAVDLDKTKQDADPYFFMARAYRDAFDMQKATDMYQQVLTMHRGRVKQADDELAVVQKIVRAAPGTLHGKLIAFQPSLSRADVAALFVEELELPRLYARGNQARFDTSFKAPDQGQLQADTLQRMPDATDIQNNPLRSDIEQVMKLHVLGLEPNPDHKFYPDAKLTRAEFAMMVEDILTRVTGEQGLKTKFIGQQSPFPDIRSDAPYFNAVEVVVTRNLMEAKDKINGVFAPADPVSGADALLVIRQLKSELQSYLRS